MKTRNSSGVGQKVDLEFDVDTLKIKDLGDEDEGSFKPQGATIYQSLKKTSTVVDSGTGEIKDPNDGLPISKIKTKSGQAGIHAILAGLNAEKD
jgi:hypothetical protein